MTQVVASSAPGLGRRVAQNIAGLMSGRIVSTILQFAAFGVIAQYLGPGNLGVYAFAVAMATLFRVVPNFGFSPVVARDVAQDPARERELVPNVVYMRIVLGLAAYGVLAAFVFLAGYDGANREAALIAGTLLFLLPLDSLQIVLQVRLKQGWIAWSETIKAVVFLGGAIALAQAEATVFAFLWLYVATSVLSVLIVVVVALRWAELSWAIRTHLWKGVIAAAAPLALANLFIQMYARIDLVILAAMKPAEDVGQYGAAYKFLEAALLVPSLLTGTLLPVFASSFKAGRDVLDRRYRRSIHLITVIALPVAIGGGMIAWRVLPDLPGFSKFDGGGVALSILCPAAGLAFVAFVIQGALISGHQQRRVLRISAIGAVFNIAINLVLIVPFSYVGAAVATTLTELVVLAWSIREARIRLGVTWPVDRLKQVVMATAASALAMVPAYALPALAQLAIGAVAYVVAARLLGAVTPADLEGLSLRDRSPAAGATIAEAGKPA
jgi:O-antigen/teichoic acid export membrane protein